MNKKVERKFIGYALILGSVWGVIEVALGVGLRTCASTVTGSIMTGVALFFIAASYVLTRSNFIPILVVMIAALFKLFDSVLLGIPVMSGAIGNPIFAFILEGLAFVILISIFRRMKWTKTKSRVLLGGGSALIAVSLFPLVKFATGIPACVYPSTMIPLSILFAPLAILFSGITVPLGFVAGEKLRTGFTRIDLRIERSFLRHMIFPAAMGIGLTLIVLFRMVVITDF